MKRFTYDDVVAYIKEHDINNTCQLLSTEYVGINEPLKFKCNICGEEFTRNFHNVRRNDKFSCARCSRGRNLKIQDIKDFLAKNDINHDCELLSTTYKNTKEYLLFRCNHCGKEFKRNTVQLKEGNFKCYDCLKKEQGGKNKKSIQDVKNFILENDINHDCTLLSTEYVNNSSRLLFRCNCCNREFERTFQTLQAKKTFKCFRCSHNLPEETETDIYSALKSFFRGKIYSWKQKMLKEKEQVCDITNKKDVELHLHHLTSFQSILNQASENTNIPLIYYPADYENNGYDLDILVEEFLKLHDQCEAVLLSKEVHILFHRLYGYKDNTPEQYYEFKERYKKGEFLSQNN